MQHQRPQAMPANFDGYAREGYAGNEAVFACIEQRATSVAEPRMKARIRGAWTTEAPKGSILELLTHPNPFMDGFEFFATVIMHRDLAGNAFALKVRSGAGKVVELWMLRPDQVKVVPDRARYIARYEIDLGMGEIVRVPVNDIIHWKTRNPLNPFYGQPPLMAASGRVDIDNYMRGFVSAYFENAGIPGGVLSVDGQLSDEARKEIKARFRNGYAGPRGWHELLVLDKSKATFTPMTTNLGSSGLVVPELERITVRRVCAVFGVPPALIGLDDANTSYASMEVIRRSFWDDTLSPLYKELAAPLNDAPKRYADQVQTGLTSDFPGVDEVAFDLTDVRALREDEDKLAARERADLGVGGLTLEEFRERRGYGAVPAEGTFLVPSNFVAVPAVDVRAGNVGPKPATPPEATGEAE